ncbi:MAG: 2-oxo acid dehydrogenase subunit E2 [Armatimonadetes bacterium]|nr:2-oxo acid dehydrogenase subunit E2 [Armatimonadota bacterium]
MPKVAIQIPQIGEGLQEARLVAYLKQPGDKVRRDEPIYQMETDKAVMDVESPYEGVLVQWLAAIDTILPIGADVAQMEIAIENENNESVVSEPATSGNQISLCIPMIGEGLQEARLVSVLKQPGDIIHRDEPIYQMETDKAVMDVESPYEGRLIGWKVPVDTVLPIGAEVGTIELFGEAPTTSVAATHAPKPTPAAAPVASDPGAGTPSARRTDVPPRTRAYAKEKGIDDATLAQIPATGSKLMPADIDAYLAGGVVSHAPKSSYVVSSEHYAERELSQKQRLLSSRLVRGSQLVVPGTMSMPIAWAPIEAERARLKAAGGDFQPSAFTMFAYAAAKAVAQFPAFRSTMIGDSTLRTYHHVNLGIAVALPGDELVIAVVDQADTLAWPDFAKKARESIDLARNGKDQVNESVTISLTNMQSYNLRDAVAVVVPPAVATLFLGAPYYAQDPDSPTPNIKRQVNIALTFDHRILNGVGASEFLLAIKKNVEEIQSILS